MRTSSNATARQRWLNTYRISVPILLLALVAGVGVLLFRPAPQSSQVTFTVTQADKVAQASSFLETVGFNNPVYLGVTQGSEGKYPTYRATAIGGKSVDLWIRTTRNGGWEIQPTMLFETVASADDFAGKAQKAVYNWEHMPPDIKPRTDGAYGEYEGRKYMFEQLSKYNPDKSYWDTQVDETRGWPSR